MTAYGVMVFKFIYFIVTEIFKMYFKTGGGQVNFIN
jgi:hypothetical protein